MTRGEQAAPSGLDDGAVAILPFEYSGPEELEYLAGHVFHLLSARFTGDVGPRATDAMATAAIWDEVLAAGSSDEPARAVAERLGAGLILSGSVLPGPDGLTLLASLRDAGSDEQIASASERGAADSVHAVVDRLAASLLSLSGGFEESLEQLTSTQFPASREWLEGQEDFRRGRLRDAYEHFVRAVEIDSTFALASLWVADAGNNLADAIADSTASAALDRAWRHRDRLSDRDRVYLNARRGPNHPDPSTREETVQAYLAAASLNPNRANLWYFLGENLLHRPLDAEAVDRAARYFERSLDFDARNFNSLLHLLIAHLRRRDVPGSIDAAERLAALDTTNAMQRLPLFLQAVARRDTARAVEFYDAVQQLQSAEALEILFMDAPTMLAGRNQAAALIRTFDRLRRALLPGTAPILEYHHLFYGFEALGQPVRALDALAEYERGAGVVEQRVRLLSALYGSLPNEVGSAAANAIATSGEPVTFSAVGDRTALELWRIAGGDFSNIEATVATYRRVQAEYPEAHRLAIEAQALLLDAMAQAHRGDAAARETLDAMDAIFALGLADLDIDVYDAMILATAQTYERLGVTDRALAVLERETSFDAYHLPFNARFARERGSLAARAGDISRAIAEYEFYTRMRAAAEPALQPEVDAVRAALADLRSDASQRR